MTQTLVAQLLWFHVVIEADHDFVDSLRFLTNSAHHNFEPHLAMRYRIKRKGSSVEVHDGFDQLFSGKSVAEVSEALRTHMLRRLFQYASLCGWVRLRAA